MAKYCDEFSFDEVFEDTSYVHVFVNQSRHVNSYPYPLQEHVESKEEAEEEEEQDLDYSKEQELFEMKLDDLEFVKESMTEEQLDSFWKKISDSRFRRNNKSKVYPIYDLVQEDKEVHDLYFYREIMTV
jgi:hypothetical protein